METLSNDLRYGLRALLKNPIFAIVVILALALGIGANTAVFSVINAVLLQPLPYPQPDHIVSIAGRFTGIGIPDDRNRLSPPEFTDLRRFASAFSDISVVQGSSFNIRIGEVPERIGGAVVSANYFRLMGISPQLGRAFTPEEEQTGRDTVVILGHGFWQGKFGADRNAVGRPIEINGRTHTIVGVMPAGFDHPFQSEIWTPLAFTNAQLAPNFRGNHGLIGLARIKPELTFEQALSDMDRVTQQIIEIAPEYPYRKFNFQVLIRPILEDLVGEIRPAMGMLMGAVVLVLLIACANAANLLMVRASAREREIGIRAALGAGRGRLIRQLLTESTILSVIGATVGVALARVGISAIAGIGGEAFPRLAQARMDWETLLFTTGIALATGIFFGIVPALQVSQFSAHESLKEGGRSSTAGTGHQRLRRLFVTAEVALSLALLIGAGLLIKSFMRLQDIDPGFRAEGVLTMRVVLPQARYAQPELVRTFYRRLTERISQIPGIESFGAINGLPLSGQGGSGTTTVDTSAVAPENASPEADWRVVMPGYFQTMKTPLVAGRFFDEHDNETSAPVAIIDETMAKSYWPGENAVGKKLKRGGRASANPWTTVVGVVKHIRYGSLERPSRVQLYWPHAQTPSSGMSLVLRTRAAPAAMAETVQRTMMTLDTDQPVYAVRPMEELLADSMMRRRIVMLLLAVFAGAALTLAALGIYGVISYWVSQRAHEIGIRMALGASRARILQMVLGQSLSILIVGVAFGLAGALALSRIMTALLFNVGATDPWTYMTLGFALLGVGMLAGLVPALRATLVNPIRTLRQE
jgi:putative ABC transport system permease protein